MALPGERPHTGTCLTPLACLRRVCVVYGALPPEMRNQQARLFNEPDNGYDILVASDAVGMGLNLNIKRIVFHTLLKLDGPNTWAPVPTPHIRQIAGKGSLQMSRMDA